MSSFGTYLVGFIILIIGLGIAAYLLNVPPMWILVGVVVLLGSGMLMATSRTKPRDPPAVCPIARELRTGWLGGAPLVQLRPTRR